MLRASLLFGVFLLALATPAAAADDRGLQVRPLSYSTELQEGEVKQGVVDIANPSDEPVEVSVSVKGFRQGDDGLEFYDDPQLARGISLDHQELSLEGKDAYRLVFEAASSQLPAGEVKAAVIFTTQNESEMVGQNVSVGSLLMINNQKAATVTPVNDESKITQIVFVVLGAILLLAIVFIIWRDRRKKVVFKQRN